VTLIRGKMQKRKRNEKVVAVALLIKTPGRSGPGKTTNGTPFSPPARIQPKKKILRITLSIHYLMLLIDVRRTIIPGLNTSMIKF
jgi:hypothetical protein